MMNLGLFHDCSSLTPFLWLSPRISKAPLPSDLLKLNPATWQQICLLVEYPLVYVELTSCKGSAPAF
jgi:hypothetical protein